jgi:hypothetical protein
MKKVKKPNIEEILCPERGNLKIRRKCATAEILDAELDTIKCEFNNDWCVQIDTSNLTYITLTLENLEDLTRLVYEAQEFYEK